MRRTAAGWRVAARLARREVRRRPWRSALVVTLIALPVAGVTFAAIFTRTTTPTAAERRAWDFGQADDVVIQAGNLGEARMDSGTFADAVRQAYPAGSRVVQFSEGQEAVTDPDGHLHQVALSNRPLDDPLLEGTVRLTHGRAPERADEVAVSDDVLDLAEAEIGDQLELFLFGDVTVTGVVANPGCRGCELVVGTETPTHVYTSRHAFVETPPGFAYPDSSFLEAIQAQSWILSIYPGAYTEDVRDQLAVIYVAGGVTLAGVAIIAAAAFAVAARRQLRLLGLLSASGIPPSGLRQTVLLQGSTAGLVGSVIGVTLGLVGMVAVHPLLDEYNTSEYIGALEVHPLDLLAPLVLGVAAATAAAWLPARTAARVPVLAALAGRKPQGRLPASIPVAGLIAVCAGVLALAFYTQHADEFGWGYRLVAALAVMFGGTALAPWVVSHTAPLALRLRGGARVAARDLGRQRLRSGAVVAAVMVPAGLSVLTTTAAVTDDARDDASRQMEAPYGVHEDQALLTAVDSAIDGEGTPLDELADELDYVRAILPGAAEIDVDVALPPGADRYEQSAYLEISVPGVPPVQDPGVPTPDRRVLVVNEPAELAEAGMPTEVVDALENGRVVVFAGSLPADARLALVGVDVALDRDDVLVSEADVPRGNTIAVISPATAESWGLTELYYGTLFEAPRPLSEQQRAAILALFSGCDYRRPACRDQQIRDELLARQPSEPDGYVEVYYRPDGGQLTLQIGVAGGSLVFTLLIVAVALALTSAESRDERALLDAIGAPPRVRRSITAWQAGLLPAMAMALAVPGGLAVAFAVKSADDYSGVGVQVPWLAVGLIAVGIPLISAGVAWLGSTVTGRRRQDLSAIALASD